jgi:hypothetical protein
LLVDRTVCSGLIWCPNGLFGASFGVQTAFWPSERSVRVYFCVQTACSEPALVSEQLVGRPNGLFKVCICVRTDCSEPALVSEQLVGRPKGLFGPNFVNLVSEWLVRSQLWCPNSLLAVITVCSGQFLCPNGLFRASFGVRTACWPSERSARAYYCVYLVSEWLVRSQPWCPNSLLAVRTVCLVLIWCLNGLFGASFGV